MADLTKSTKQKLLGNTLQELQELVVAEKQPKFVGMQLAQWLYQRNATSFDDMTNLSKKFREVLNQKYDIGRISHSDVQISVDGTKKYLFPVGDKKNIESVYIPETKRNTLCVSSQVGCKMGCVFCMTARQGFQSQLSAGDIVNQVASLPEKQDLTNIVFMGMGEPFDNMANLLKSLEILTSDYGYGFSPKKITVSTIGLIPGIREFIEKTKCHLAISLHTPFDEERKKLMPVQKAYSATNVIKELENLEINKHRRISFEYILFKGVNDSERHVKELAMLLNKLRCRINLIRFHPIPDSPLSASDNDKLVLFKEELEKKGITTTVRASRGQDIFAACGLLSTKKLSKSNKI